MNGVLTLCLLQQLSKKQSNWNLEPISQELLTKNSKSVWNFHPAMLGFMVWTIVVAGSMPHDWVSVCSSSCERL